MMCSLQVLCSRQVSGPRLPLLLAIVSAPKRDLASIDSMDVFLGRKQNVRAEPPSIR